MLENNIPNRVAITTYDNPFNPFTQFVEWFLFDEEKGYHTCALLGRIAMISDSLSDEENNQEVERAIDLILQNDYESVYRKVFEEQIA